MKALILNGAVALRDMADAVDGALSSRLAARGYEVARQDLTAIEVPDCNGDFGCWTVTPGVCVQPGPHRDLARAMDGPRMDGRPRRRRGRNARRRTARGAGRSRAKCRPRPRADGGCHRPGPRRPHRGAAACPHPPHPGLALPFCRRLGFPARGEETRESVADGRSPLRSVNSAITSACRAVATKRASWRSRRLSHRRAPAAPSRRALRRPRNRPGPEFGKAAACSTT